VFPLRNLNKVKVHKEGWVLPCGAGELIRGGSIVSGCATPNPQAMGRRQFTSHTADYYFFRGDE
jgi:hypothetical protein